MHNILRGCPVRPLGIRGDAYVFSDHAGLTKTLSRGQLATRRVFVGLFGGDDTWLRHHFPVELNSDGQPITTDFSMCTAAIFMAGACSMADAMAQEALDTVLDGIAGHAS
ncbi:hypothetical protein [Komagataeibacter sp. FNDCR2]|uniref:hypothetical protein n=1 Tax=Komagataeibacter sp. FNDCR2 TaxID=2878682 RepID=UPI001E49B8BF|nr:hypothetical protein [Komagataeibacter sp. FNDCR2]MCE2576050.1 hypothetical protein [Komagataeibacter sp. FNDCR2]